VRAKFTLKFWLVWAMLFVVWHFVQPLALLSHGLEQWGRPSVGSSVMISEVGGGALTAVYADAPTAERILRCVQGPTCDIDEEWGLPLSKYTLIANNKHTARVLEYSGHVARVELLDGPAAGWVPTEWLVPRAS
jgi:hypothetical protein